MCYYNHDFEFKKQDGQFPFDLVLNNTDKELVKMEMDIYRIFRAGQDPVALFDKHPKRFLFWQAMDMDMVNTPHKAFTEVGNGTIDFKKVFAHADKAGMKYFLLSRINARAHRLTASSKAYRILKRILFDYPELNRKC